MKSEIVTPIIVGIIIGGLIGYFGAYTIYTPQIEELESIISDQNTQINNLENLNVGFSEDLSILEAQYEKSSSDLSLLSSQYETLDSEHTLLLENYASLTELYETSVADYEQLESNYGVLESSKKSLESIHESSLSHYARLSDDVLELYDMLGAYGSLEDSFQRVLCQSEVEKLASIVTLITDPDSNWVSNNAIYNYLINNVEYALDPEIPQIIHYSTVTIDYHQYITGFSTSTRQELIQTPDYTLENGQGDCEDQAILIYAMIKYYLINIYGTNYCTYLMRLELGDGGGHMAVLIPVQDGNVCILDSAGNYYTSRWGYIAQKVVSTELNAYSNLWSDHQGIDNIVLYDVDISDGDFTIDFEGTLEELIPFLES